MSDPKSIPPARPPKSGEKLERRGAVLESIRRSDSSSLSGRSGITAWLASVTIHTLLILVIAWFWTVQKGTVSDFDQPSGIAVLHRDGDSEEYTVDNLPSGTNTSSNEAQGGSQATEASASLPPIDIDGMLGALQGAESSGLGAGVLGGSDATAGSVAGTPGGKKGLVMSQSRFYGIEGVGNSFVYVIDRSDSMNEFDGAPFRAAKRELLESLQSLQSVNQFQIIFYNDAPSLFRSKISGAAGLIRGHDNEREQAAQFVRQVEALGGTEHVAALRSAMRMQPDVIFFLTDAAEPRMSTDQLNSIVANCERVGMTIHSVEFGSGAPPEEKRWIELMANKTGGKYRYVDTTKLGR